MNTTWSSRSINPELVKGLVELASEERHNWDSWGNGFEWVTLMNAGQLPAAAALLAKHEARLCTVTALNRQLAEPVTTLAYHFDVHGYTVTVTVPLDPAENSVPTITPWFRNADWNEREFAELFDVHVDGNTNPKRLFLDPEIDEGILNEVIPLTIMMNGACTKAHHGSERRARRGSGKGGARMSQTSSFSLPIGPVHVALEEPVYFHLDVDGETVRKVEITSGHVHRGMEGMATQRNFFKNTTLTERVCSLCSNSHSLTYCMAVENVLGMTPPPRAQYLRVLAEETKRVASHLFNIAIFAHNVGFKSLFLHIMEVRENMQDVKETIYGNRMNLSANCIGGVKFDMDDSLTMYMLERLDTVEEAVKRVEKVFRTDPLIAKRSRGVGVLSREDAWALGVVGPVARGSGLDIDVRKNTPYLVYPDLYFDIVKEQDGDVWSRAMVRVREVFESIRLLRQCLDKLPDGPLAVHMERIPESESVARSEAPRGELIYYLQTNGTDTPARLKWRVPSYMNWEALTVMMKDCQLADIPVIVNSIDPCVSCTER